MAKNKLVLVASPTFKATVQIPRPGADPAPVEFVFKHRNKDDFLEWIKSAGNTDDVDLILEMASGWDLDDAFTVENVRLMTQSFGGAARAIANKYTSEQTGAKLGN